ncbi:hypothetical protein BJY00DRAFT_121957 [Aspergillus carlsbadensis]|nr:hypothetical protein BJY00DRAFT_121957 [Aspergillus carlsbadensis]
MTKIIEACMKYLQLLGGERKIDHRLPESVCVPWEKERPSLAEIFSFSLQQHPRFDSLTENFSFQGVLYVSCPISSGSCTFLLTLAVRCAIWPHVQCDWNCSWLNHTCGLFFLGKASDIDLLFQQTTLKKSTVGELHALYGSINQSEDTSM